MVKSYAQPPPHDTDLSHEERMAWTDQAGGGGGHVAVGPDWSWTQAYVWPPSPWEDESAVNGTVTTWYSPGPNQTVGPCAPQALANEFSGVALFGPLDLADLTRGSYLYDHESQAGWSLFTGGKAVVGRKNLFALSTNAVRVVNPAPPDANWTPGSEAIPNPQVKLGGVGSLGADGWLYVALPDNETVDITPFVASLDYYRWSAIGADKYGLQLDSVTFTGTNGCYDVLNDTNGVAYPTPQWANNEADGTVQSYPVLYVSGSSVEAQALFKSLYDAFPCPVVIHGHASNGMDFWETNTPGSWLLVTPFSTTAFPASRVDFLNPLSIQWSYAVPGRSEFIGAGTSANQVYVTLRAPTNGVQLFHTVAHLACENPGATTDDQAVGNTWAFLAGPANVTTWDRTPLTYYGTSTGGSCTDTATLLRTHDGQCHSFATLLVDSFRANGVPEVRITRVLPAAAHDAFGVKNISFSPTPAFPSEPTYKYADTDLDTAVAGIPGQNTDPPLAKLFSQHFVVHRGSGSEYFDPSYGVTTTSSSSYSANIGAWMRTSDGHWRDAQASGLQVQFMDNDPY